MKEKINARQDMVKEFKNNALRRKKESPASNIHRAYTIYFREAWRNALKRYSKSNMA